MSPGAAHRRVEGEEDREGPKVPHQGLATNLLLAVVLDIGGQRGLGGRRALGPDAGKAPKPQKPIERQGGEGRCHPLVDALPRFPAAAFPTRGGGQGEIHARPLRHLPAADRVEADMSVWIRSIRGKS